MKDAVEVLAGKIEKLETENADLKARIDRWNSGGNYVATNAKIKKLKAENEQCKEAFAAVSEGKPIGPIVEKHLIQNMQNRIAELEQQLNQPVIKTEWQEAQERIAELEDQLFDRNMLADANHHTIETQEGRIAELEAENERLRRPACGTEQVWLDTIRHDDEQALLWFRAMQRESELKKKAMEDAKRYRLARKFEFLTDRQLLSIDAAMEGE